MDNKRVQDLLWRLRTAMNKGDLNEANRINEILKEIRENNPKAFRKYDNDYLQAILGLE